MMQDVGGITPGSMPPMSHTLAEEGAAILSFKLVKGGKFQVRPCSHLRCCAQWTVRTVTFQTTVCYTVASCCIAHVLPNNW